MLVLHRVEDFAARVHVQRHVGVTTGNPEVGGDLREVHVHAASHRIETIVLGGMRQRIALQVEHRLCELKLAVGRREACNDLASFHHAAIGQHPGQLTLRP